MHMNYYKCIHIPIYVIDNEHFLCTGELCMIQFCLYSVFIYVVNVSDLDCDLCYGNLAVLLTK